MPTNTNPEWFETMVREANERPTRYRTWGDANAGKNALKPGQRGYKSAPIESEIIFNPRIKPMTITVPKQTKTQKANAAKSERINRERDHWIEFGRELERNDFIARVRRRLVHFRGFHPAYQEVFAELARTEKWLERRKRKAKRI